MDGVLVSQSVSGVGPIPVSPVKSRTCRQYVENVIGDEQHFLVNYKTFESIRQNNFSLTEEKDPSFIYLY